METYPEPPQLPLVLACNGPPPLMRNPVRVAHGLYTDLSTRGAEPWKAAQQLSLARCAAACMQTPSALALSHESAALVHGLWVYRHEPDISLVMPFTPAEVECRFLPFLEGEVGSFCDVAGFVWSGRTSQQSRACR